MTEYSSALELALKWHDGQLRRDGSAYILHPIRVAIYLKNRGYDEDCQIIGLFHDLLEDTNVPESEIEAFGPDILRVVKLLTKKPDDRKYMEGYLDRILADPVAKAVKNADRIDNLTDSLNCEDYEFQRRYLAESNKKYRGRFSEELDSCIDALQAYVNEMMS